MTTFAALLAEHVATSAEKQDLLAELVDERDWAADLEEGVIRFGDDIVARTEVLGSESLTSGTWLWAWANDQWPVPEALLESARRARQRGVELGIPELAEPSFALDEVRTGHSVAMAVVGLLGLPAYYSGPSGNARALLVVHHPALRLGPPSALRGLMCLSKAIGAFGTDHRAMIEGYARQRGLGLVDAGRVLTLTFPDGELTVKLDRRGRVKDISS